MNRATWFCGAASLFVVACQPVSPASDSPITIDLGDANDYAAWLEETGQKVDPLPFHADPLDVSATGEVRATPDVAVIVATLSAEDPNESRALDGVSAQVNAVQAALTDYQVETGFTGIGSEVKRDEACLNHNRDARQRHRQILADYRFNQRLDRQGDTQTRRRIPRPRIAEKVCAAEEIRVFTRMVVRIQPADVAGDVLIALGDAGAEDAQLLGYDFSDYDSLYQRAAVRAVDQAKRKAEAVAKGAGGTLGELLEIDVDRPERLRRFGPQPRVVRAPRSRTGDGIPALRSFEMAELQHQIDSKENRDETIIVTGSRLARSPAPPPPAPAMAFSAMDDMEETMRSRGEMLTLAKQSAEFESTVEESSTTNALAMTLMSGPQIIRVSARLSYDYATPLDGMILTDGDEPA